MSFVVSSVPRPGVALLALNRPEARNALSTALLGQLAAAFIEGQPAHRNRC